METQKQVKKNFNHISEVWEAIRECGTTEELKEQLQWIPPVFGSFWYEVIDTEVVRVYNRYEDLGMEQEEAEDLIEIEISEEEFEELLDVRRIK